jgi:VCBS repeat-containing protein
MKKLSTLFSVFMMLALMAGLALQATPAQALAGTYFTTTDNENDAHTGAADGDMDVTVGAGTTIEFNINIPVDGLPTTEAVLAIYALDVDEEQGQLDQVSLNGTVLGYLSGTNGVWSTTPFVLPAGLLVEGNNLVQIVVDTTNDGWVVTVDWGQIAVDGGVGIPGRINSMTVTSFSDVGGTITLNVDVVVEALANGTFDLETNLYDPSGNSPAADLQAGFAMTTGQIVTKSIQFVFPAGTNGDVYTIRGFLFDTATGLLNSIKSNTWTYATNAAPVADDDSYNTPMGTLLNGSTVLAGDTDADSDPLSAVLVSGPSHDSGSFALASDGTFNYTPANGFSGADTFTYKANDGTADSNVATVTINVVNNAPTALALSNRFIQEERPASVIVGALSSVDTDLTDAVTYSLASTLACDGTDNGFFAVDGTNFVTSATPIDYQTKQFLSVCLRVTDLGGLTFDQQVTVVVRSIHQFPMDFDGDGMDEIVVFRPSTGTWHLRDLPPIIAFGQAGDLPVPADYNGDGKDDIAVFRPSEGNWYIRGQAVAIHFGMNGDIPLAVDYNGDGKDDIAVFRPSTGTWHIRGQVITFSFGINGDVPVPADYNGDGKADMAVFRPSTGTWHVRNQITSLAFGKNGDIPVVTDYNHDGKADIAVYRPDNGTWYFSNVANGATFLTPTAFGAMYDQPFPMFYTNTTKPELVVIRAGATMMEWHIRNVGVVNFGANDDTQLAPVPFK